MNITNFGKIINVFLTYITFSKINWDATVYILISLNFLLNVRSYLSYRWHEKLASAGQILFEYPHCNLKSMVIPRNTVESTGSTGLPFKSTSALTIFVLGFLKIIHFVFLLFNSNLLTLNQLLSWEHCFHRHIWLVVFLFWKSMKYHQQTILSHGSFQLDTVNHWYILKRGKDQNRPLWDPHADSWYR